MLKKIFSLLFVVLCVVLSIGTTTFAYDDKEGEEKRPIWEAKDLARKAELAILIKGSNDPNAMSSPF